MNEPSSTPTQSAEILQRILHEKQRRNPSYSLRAAARDLGLSSGFLSLVLRGKKRLTFKRAVQFVQILQMDEQLGNIFLRSVALESTKDSACRGYLEKAFTAEAGDQSHEYAILELDRFRALSEWHHIAILDLTLIEGFEADPAWIAEELGISVDQVNSAKVRLQRLGLLEVRGSRWIKTSAKLAIPTTYSDRAMREFQGQMIQKAHEALQSPDPEDFAARDISGVSMAINPARITEAKVKIQRFRRELLEFMSTGPCTELYRMNVQLFRLNKKSGKSKGRK